MQSLTIFLLLTTVGAAIFFYFRSRRGLDRLIDRRDTKKPQDSAESTSKSDENT
jgi:hypothetical protein